MRHVVTCMVLALVAVLLQVMVMDGVPLPGGSVPDIALVLVVALGLTQGPATGMLTGFFAGLDLDLVSPASHLIGESALIFCLVGYGCGRLADWLDRSALRLLAAALIGVAAGETLQAAVGMMVGDPGVTLPAVRHILPAAVLYDVLLCSVVLSIAALASRRSVVRQPRARPVRPAELAGMRTTIGIALPRSRGRAGGGPLARMRPARAERGSVAALAGMPAARPVRLRAGILDEGRAGSRPGDARSSSSDPRSLGAGRGRTVRRPRLRPDRGGSAIRIGPRRALRSRPARLRLSGRRAGGAPLRVVPLRAGQPAGSLFRRQVRVCRQVPRWTRRRSAAQGGGAGGSGGRR